MTAFSLKSLVVLAALVVAGCSGLPQDGRYQDGRGGSWGSFRAEAPTVVKAT